MHSVIGLWGCQRSGLLDLWNCSRTMSYWRQHAPTSRGVVGPGCCPPEADTWIPFSSAYTDPVTDDAWWYSPQRPESARFLGLQVTSIVGIDEGGTDRTSTQTGACNGSLLHGPLIDPGYTIVVEGVLRGLDCCSVKYGLEVLRQQLRGCGCGECRGTQLRMLSCLPPDPLAELSCSTFVPPAGITDPWRTFGNVVLKEQPVVTNVGGISCGSCGCGTLTRVRFTLRAGPGQYLERFTLLGPITLPDLDGCTVAVCSGVCPDDDVLQDPNCLAPLLPDPDPVRAACFCPPLFYKRYCQIVSLGDRPFPVEFEAVITSGSGVVRNLRVAVWQLYPGMPDDFYTECNMCAGFAVSYIPAGATWQRSACAGVTVSQFGRTLDASSTLLTPSGSPGSPCIRIPCGDLRICIDIDELPADATITLFGREVEP